MKYIKKGVEIDSERAAKSYLQPNKFLCALLKSLDHSKKALDYGCGKFRYTKLLLEIFDRVVAVDSRAQLTKTQNIHGKIQRGIDFKPKRVSVFYLEQKKWLNQKYDFILLAHVLSAIPSRQHRMHVLGNISRLLKRNGTALIVCQYKDAYYENQAKKDNTTPFLDGVISHNGKKGTFFGLIQISKLLPMLKTTGLDAIDIKKKDNCYYITVSKEHR